MSDQPNGQCVARVQRYGPWPDGLHTGRCYNPAKKWRGDLAVCGVHARAKVVHRAEGA